jgi:hypothetical protein
VTSALHAHAITTQEDIPKVNDFTAFELQLVLWHAFVQTVSYYSRKAVRMLTLDNVFLRHFQPHGTAGDKVERRI